MDKLELQKVANEVRKDIVTAVHAAKAGHPGGSLSAADVFTYLYFEEMNIDPRILRRQTVTVLSFPKDIQHRDSILYLQREDISKRGSENTSSSGLLSSGTSGYEAYSGR